MSGANLVRAAILVSGQGSNMEALIKTATQVDYPAEIVLVVSDRPGAPALQKAEAAGVAACCVDRGSYADRAAFDQALDERLRAEQVELIALAGFMRVLTETFVMRWRGRLVNIHPSLLPAFRGLHTHQRALAAGVKLHGCSVHHVVPELDAGPIIAQAAVPVLPGDDPETLGARVLAAEHRLFPAALAELARSMRGAVPASPWTRPAETDAILMNPLPQS